MAETVRKSKLTFLKLVAKLFSSVLLLLGVLSGCDSGTFDPPVSAPQSGVDFHGMVVSSENSSPLHGIQIQLSSPDLSTVYDSVLSSKYWGYFLYLEEYVTPWPDSILVTATDIDGEACGYFAPQDTLILLDSNEEYQDFQIDFVLDEE